jgi:hypothetical protein
MLLLFSFLSFSVSPTHTSLLYCTIEQDNSEDEDEFDGAVHVRHGKKLPATSR